ncbi:haloalkane dehalogenase [Vibrio makurazakiensis]|uniref:haloalkane dehalogenase n=1 Tax=Vibrio makurazakiensis TaxID=2910250 RepID=UPI003D136D66
MKIKEHTIRTPDSQFNDLVDYPFSAHYLEIDGMRMHYLDEGSEHSKTIFLFHGQPSWSYLYRHMIPLLVSEGYRVIVPDLIGFGKSDKPTQASAHTYTNHVQWMTTFVRKINIYGAAAFFQDWGGMIGLRVLAQEPLWLSRLILSNTALAEMNGLEKFMVPKVLRILASLAGKADLAALTQKTNYGNWASYFRHANTLEIGEVIQALSVKNLSKLEKQAYDAPFPNSDYYAAPRKMPEIVASELNQVNADWEKLKDWNQPVLTLFSDKDPFLADKGYDVKFQENFNGAQHQPHSTVKNASHFLQEDESEQLVQKTVTWLQQTNF